MIAHVLAPPPGSRRRATPFCTIDMRALPPNGAANRPSRGGFWPPAAQGHVDFNCGNRDPMGIRKRATRVTGLSSGMRPFARPDLGSLTCQGLWPVFFAGVCSAFGRQSGAEQRLRARMRRPAGSGNSAVTRRVRGQIKPRAQLPGPGSEGTLGIGARPGSASLDLRGLRPTLFLGAGAAAWPRGGGANCQRRARGWARRLGSQDPQRFGPLHRKGTAI